jgi:glycosyl hydrolase family 39 (putative alpha-L-iduronidase)
MRVLDHGGRRREQRSIFVRRHKSEIAVALAALLWIGAVALAVRAEFHKSAFRAVPLPAATCPGLMVGVHSTLAFTNDPRRRVATVTAIRNVLGAQVVRDSLLWHQVEAVKGRRDWSRPDSVVKLLRAAGIEPLLVVVGSPSWANGVPASTPQHYLYVPPQGPALNTWIRQYSDFLAAAVKRYHRFVHRWEIWNEPNLAASWISRPDPAAYAQVYDRLRATILSVDPKAQVAVGGLAEISSARSPDISGLSFLRSLIRAGSHIGYVAVHPYPTNEHSPTVDFHGQNNFDDIARVHALLVRSHLQAPIWVTEWGWSSAIVGRQRQAQYVQKSLSMLENRYPYVRLATYFVDHDVPPGLFQGLLNQSLQPKPAAAVFRNHAHQAVSDCRGVGAGRPASAAGP